MNQLKTEFSQCNLQLNLCKAEAVLPCGLGGWIYIVCDYPSCKTVNKIAVEKQHKRTAENTSSVLSKSPIFDINTKAASGMLHAGIGFVSSKFPEYVFGPSVILNSTNVATFKATLLPLQKGKFISQSMAAKIARGGLNYNHPKTAY